MPEGLSTLFSRRRGRMLYFRALASTNLVCASGPSPASTTKIAPSTMPTTRSTYVPHRKRKVEMLQANQILVVCVCANIYIWRKHLSRCLKCIGVQQRDCANISMQRYTSPPKSACPGVSTMFSSLSFHEIDVTCK